MYCRIFSEEKFVDDRILICAALIATGNIIDYIVKVRK